MRRYSWASWRDIALYQYREIEIPEFMAFLQCTKWNQMLNSTARSTYGPIPVATDIEKLFQAMRRRCLFAYYLTYFNICCISVHVSRYLSRQRDELRPGSFGISFLAGSRLFPSAQRPDQLWSPLGLQYSRKHGHFPGVKSLEREADHWSPTGVEVKNIWIYRCTFISQYDFME
jgi:hypothetical protein